MAKLEKEDLSLTALSGLLELYSGIAHCLFFETLFPYRPISVIDDHYLVIGNFLHKKSSHLKYSTEMKGLIVLLSKHFEMNRPMTTLSSYFPEGKFQEIGQ